MLRGRSVGVIHSLDASLPATTVTGIGVAARVLGDAAAGRRVLDPEGEEAYGDVLEAGQELAKIGSGRRRGGMHRHDPSPCPAPG